MNPELEYTALREEILKRIESRQQLISITLTIAAAVLGVGWTSRRGYPAHLSVDCNADGGGLGTE